MSEKYKRKNYFINKEFQGKFTFLFLTVGLVVTLFTTLVIWYFSVDELENFLYRSHLPRISPLDIVIPIALKSIAIGAVALLLISYVLTSFIFRRISKRLKAFDDAVLRIGKGDLNIQLPTTSLKEVNGAFNNILCLIENLKLDLAHLALIQQKLSAAVEKAGQDQSGGEALKQIESLSREFETKLAASKLTLE
ncbi:MAG: HAMP domain-containing protein [Nitrospirae bacterium]|nr:MAG: HAMP domain-containing protein [Nitrospirota bacterium]